MADSARIEELKRRVQVDPASIAFAALAEEYRRAGRFDDAIETCRAGLQRHPAYLSAHVTLGRALLELGQFDEAREELEHVLRAAPENLAAIRGLAEIHHRRGELPEALEQYRSALNVAKHDAELEDTVVELSKQVTPAEPPAAEPISLVSMDPVTAAPASPALVPPPLAVPAIAAPIPLIRTSILFPTAIEDASPPAAPTTVTAKPIQKPPPLELVTWSRTQPDPEPEPDVESDPPFELKLAPDPRPDATLAALEDMIAAILRERERLTVGADHLR